MKKIIFVCTGNTCRSPMAEKISQKIAKDRNLNYKIESRGLAVFEAEPANKYAINALETYGISLKNHLAKSFNIDDIERDTLILTMTQQHKKQLLSFYPNIKGSVYGITEFIGETGDIMDPFGKPLEAYNECARQLYKIITKIFDIIKEG